MKKKEIEAKKQKGKSKCNKTPGIASLYAAKVFDAVLASLIEEGENKEKGVERIRQRVRRAINTFLFRK
mgnify:CR=1 FL=1